MTGSADRVVVSVGGSLIVPDELDLGFLSAFKTAIERQVAGGTSFYLIAGGGRIARRYQQAAEKLRGDLTRDDLDWLGVHATRLNAHLLRTLFREHADPSIVKDPADAARREGAVIIGAGWKPGWSTDYCAVHSAMALGVRRVVNLSNIDFVHDSDPRTNPTAKKIERIGWRDFRALIPAEWDPGLSSPFDPIAARDAEAAGIEVAILNGAHLERLEDYLAGRPFMGTLIR